MNKIDAFFRTHNYLVEHIDAPVRRRLMDEIDWNHRMIGIKGTRGIGKTTFLLQYAKEKFGSRDRQCLYVNMNNFYFHGRGIADFAGEFYHGGGRVLLIDQVFKQPNWSSELRRCHDFFTGSSVMRLKEENPELNGIVKGYNLTGFSFREFLNLETGEQFEPYSLDDILMNHEQIVKKILPKVRPIEHFQNYIHHGFYPFFLENRNFSENLLKTMNMMTEVDILLIKQIELKYLTKIKKLFYHLSLEMPQTPNISNLAKEINTSRATVMNYIKYLSDARLLNILYPIGEDFPKKPARVMMNNSNLIYAIYPILAEQSNVMETFMVNAIWKDHKVNQDKKRGTYLIDGEKRFRVYDAEKHKIRFEEGMFYFRYNTEVGIGNKIPLWLLGFLY